jgi:hypothetical protein
MGVSNQMLANRATEYYALMEKVDIKFIKEIWFRQ